MRKMPTWAIDRGKNVPTPLSDYFYRRIYERMYNPTRAFSFYSLTVLYSNTGESLVRAQGQTAEALLA